MVYKGREIAMSEEELYQRALSVYIELVKGDAGLMSDTDCDGLEEAAKDMVAEYYFKNERQMKDTILRWHDGSEKPECCDRKQEFLLKVRETYSDGCEYEEHIVATWDGDAFLNSDEEDMAWMSGVGILRWAEIPE